MRISNKHLFNSSFIITIFTIFLISVPTSNCIQFSVSLQSQQRFCFYQVFEAQQKYTYVSYSQTKAKHQVQVAHIDGRQWKSIFFRANADHQSTIRVDKLASAATTYSFCIKNLVNQMEKFKIQFNTGIQMLELHNLPDLSDGENLQRELNWLQQQTDNLSKRADNIEGLRRINYQINGMVGSKMIIFAIVGLVVIAGVNVVFYRILKKTFKDRKLI